MQMTVKNIFEDWSKALKIDELKGDLNRVAEDLVKVKDSIVPQAKHTMKQAEKEYRLILKQLMLAQKQWNFEVRKAGALLKKSTVEIEKALQHYQDLAIQQKNEIQKTIAQGPDGAANRSQKTSVRKRRASKKAGRKTMRGRKPGRSSGVALQH